MTLTLKLKLKITLNKFLPTKSNYIYLNLIKCPRSVDTLPTQLCIAMSELTAVLCVCIRLTFQWWQHPFHAVFFSPFLSVFSHADLCPASTDIRLPLSSCTTDPGVSKHSKTCFTTKSDIKHWVLSQIFESEQWLVSKSSPPTQRKSCCVCVVVFARFLKGWTSGSHCSKHGIWGLDFIPLSF